jgi:hypothetical protein
MKRILLSIFLLPLVVNSFAQKGYGLDGSLSFGFNGGQTVYPILLEGRIQWDDYFSTNFGLGLWNSGFKNTWKVDQTTTATLYRLSDNQTVPSLQLSSKGQFPVFKILDRTVSLFAEPKLYFLPFSARTVNMEEVYYSRTTDAIGNVTYTATGDFQNSNMKSESHSRLFGGIQAGLSIELIDNVDFALSYGYTKMDLFKELRGLNNENWPLKNSSLDYYLPSKDLQMISVGICVHYNLN